MIADLDALAVETDLARAAGSDVATTSDLDGYHPDVLGAMAGSGDGYGNGDNCYGHGDGDGYGNGKGDGYSYSYGNGNDGS